MHVQITSKDDVLVLLQCSVNYFVGSNPTEFSVFIFGACQVEIKADQLNVVSEGNLDCHYVVFLVNDSMIQTLFD